MLGKLGKAALVSSVAVAGLGFCASDAAADAFSVSVHTPNVSAGFSTVNRHANGGYVEVYQPAPRPVVTYCPPPAPVVVYRPVAVRQPVHVCRYDSRPATHYYVNDCGRRVWYTEYVRVRTCDDYHRAYYRHGDWDNDHRDHGRGRYENHGRRNDRDHHGRDRDRDNDRHDRHGRDRD